MANNLEKAMKLKENYDYQITFEDYDKQECFEELLDNAKSLRNTIFGISMMKNFKTKADEEAVKILNAILGEQVK